MNKFKEKITLSGFQDTGAHRRGAVKCTSVGGVQ